MTRIQIGNDVWSRNFIRSIQDDFRYKAIQEWQEKPGIATEQSVYCRALMSKVESGNTWGGALDSPQKIVQQCKNFKKMIRDFNSNDCARSVFAAGSPQHFYGHYPVHVTKDGFFALYDGRHRAAILLSRGLPLEVSVCTVAPEFSLLREDLRALYGGEKLYQPIPHPLFSSWESGWDNTQVGILRELFIQHRIETVLDCGCCHGYVLYVLSDVVKRACALEYNSVRYSAAKLVLSPFSYDVRLSSIQAYANTNPRIFDCIILSSVLHHMMRELREPEFERALKLLADCSPMLVYMLPNKTEEQYGWLYPSYRADPHGKIKKLLRFRNQEIKRCAVREMGVLTCAS